MSFCKLSSRVSKTRKEGSLRIFTGFSVSRLEGERGSLPYFLVVTLGGAWLRIFVILSDE